MKSVDTPDRSSHIPNREELLQMAIGAAKAGNRESARVMFRKVLSDDRRNERAMIWMAKLAPTKAERRQWLQRVLAVNPDNDTAKETLRKMVYANKAKDNRVLIIFGVIAGVLVVFGILFVLVLLPALNTH
jgi:hypothetical protein